MSFITNNSLQKIFITGTDTNVGKTYISTGLLQVFQQNGLTTTTCKPIATGSVALDKQSDVLGLQQMCTEKLSYTDINAYTFLEAIAPHIAAQYNRQTITVDLLLKRCATVLNYPADICVIEGAGGWFTPLNAHETLADFVKQLGCTVILVVGMRLGCLNHSILTWQALQQARIRVSGWIANCVEPNTMPALNDNIASLRQWLPIPYLGMVQHNASVAVSIDVNEILKGLNLDVPAMSAG